MAQREHPKKERAPAQVLSRRELLKTLAALGGAVAASSLLPEKWAKPEVGAGALPAHAQSTVGVECWLDPPDPVMDGTVTAYLQFIPGLVGRQARLDVYFDDPTPHISVLRLSNGAGPGSHTFVIPNEQGIYMTVVWMDPITQLPFCKIENVDI